MKRYVVTLQYTVTPARRGSFVPDVLARGWGEGHRFSLWGGDVLTVAAAVRATDDAEAVELVADRVAALWPQVGAGALTLQHAMPAKDLVSVGVRRRSQAGTVARRLRSMDLPGWAGRLGWLGGPGDGPEPGPDDFGGTAGVREPRRPMPSPGFLTAEATIPSAPRPT